MNKTIITIIALITVVFLIYQFFIDDEPMQVQQNQQTMDHIEIIKPLDIVDNSTNDTSETIQNQTYISSEEEKKAREIVKTIRKSNRDELIALKNNKKISYITLGEMIEKIQSQDVNSDEVVANLDRIKHNVEIAKKMAELTKQLHIEIDGEKEFDKDVYAQLLEIQKGLILPAHSLNLE